MARCPNCRAKQDYGALLFASSRKAFVCKQCGTSLRVSKLRLVPYLLIVNFVAVILGLAMVLSREYATMLVVLLVWILVAWAVYPVVIGFSGPANEQA
jgi:CXXC-20-CXXC protein